jgi:hypothetical protein
MKDTSLSEFRMNYSKILERAGKSRKPLRITPFGQPYADIIILKAQTNSTSQLGAMKGTIEIIVDIVDPSSGS